MKKPPVRFGKNRGMSSSPSVESSLTQVLAQRACQTNYYQLSDAVKTIARQCLLDFTAVTLAGSNDESVTILLSELGDQQSQSSATIIGHSIKLPPLMAALVNGTASHSLDFDDVHMAMPGHPSAPLLPAILALAECTKANGQNIIEAFVAGFDLECALGYALKPGHYDTGFHATGTLGAMGAAAACGRILNLDAQKMENAISIAATQAAGLKPQFGTMCKALHVGKAAQNGYLAAKLAERGFTAQAGIIECQQGFAATHSPDFHQDLANNRKPAGEWLLGNLFKYHASCYLTHAPIEAVLSILDQEAPALDEIESVRVIVDDMCGKVCNIQDPVNGLEIKFSLRTLVAMALMGIDTAGLGNYCRATLANGQLQKISKKTTVELRSAWGENRAVVEIKLNGGRIVSADKDSGVPEPDLDRQAEKLGRKHRALLHPVLGKAAATELHDTIMNIDNQESLTGLFARLSLQ
jgi:2-methylcitrate dehydratase PrpD